MSGAGALPEDVLGPTHPRGINFESQAGKPQGFARDRIGPAVWITPVENSESNLQGSCFS